MVNRAFFCVLWIFHFVAWAQAASADKASMRYVGYFERGAQKDFEMFKREARVYSSDLQVIEFGSFMGFAIALNSSSADAQLTKLRAMDGVASIEPDSFVSSDTPITHSEGATQHHSQQAAKAHVAAYGEQTDVEAWGIDRSDQRALPLDEIYRWREGVDGTGVKVYLIDTGVLENHEQFEGRATNDADCCTTQGCVPAVFSDTQGHGTMVAGTLASRDYGVAKGAEVHALRADKSNAQCGVVPFLHAASYIANNVEGPRIALFTLGGAANEAVDAAVSALHDAGVLVVAAAGNSNTSTCLSPGGDKVLNVGATSDADEKAFFSQYGGCTDIYAPGARILTTHNSGGTTVAQSTSFAAGHVAGAAALVMQRLMLENNGKVPTPDEITTILLEESTKDVVTGIPDTPDGPWPNRLLFTNPRP